MLALSRVQASQLVQLRQLIELAGSAKEIMDNVAHLEDILPGTTPQLKGALADSSLIEMAEREMEFIEKNNIRLILINDRDYPYRLKECADAPLVLQSMGNADLNAKHIVSIVGTRHATEYGKRVCESFVTELAHSIPDTLIISGLAYGIDICAHRAALEAGLPTIGVLAHGLDQIYPGTHRITARNMLEKGGLLTEFMSKTNPLKQFFIQRNRIVAGMSDATVVIESAARGGSLITASLASSYARDCFTFPGRVYDQYSQGCNELVAHNKAALITCADDFIKAMNWEAKNNKKKKQGIQTELFPELTSEEMAIITALRNSDEGLQINQMVIMLDKPINELLPLLFEMEMKGYIKAVAGGSYRALTP